MKMEEASETNYRLLLTCPRGFLATQLSVTLDQACDRIRHPDDELEASISEIWFNRVEKNESLFNGKKFRYGGYSLHEGESESSDRVCLHLGLTDYRTFVGTNLNPAWEKFLVSSGDDLIECQHTSSPLGNGAIVETADNKILVLQRGHNVGEFPGYFVFPGGHPEPEEVGIICHINVRNNDGIGHCLNKISQEMFDGIVREIVEEVGVPVTSLSDPIFIGISRRICNVRPTAFFFVKCNLQSEEIHHLYSNARDSYESTQLYTVSMDELEKLSSKIPGCHNGGLALYKLMLRALEK